MPSLHKLKISSKSSSSSSAKDNDNVDVDDIDEVDDQGQNVLLEIIKQLRPGCDLARITLPTFILERKSMLERITNQLQEPEIVIKAKHEAEPVDRFLGVVKWYMSGWHIAPKAVKKPLNPVLGEIFACYWDLPNGGENERAYYLSEQTSHHPPKSSYYYAIPHEKIRVDGIVIPKSKFLGNSTEAQMDGLTKLQFLDLKETYTLTQPNAFARGILFGKMKFELGDQMVIKGNGFTAEIEFKVKGFISGAYNHISGVIKKGGETLYELSGKWNDVMYIKDLKTKKESVFFDCNTAKPMPPSVKPLDEQLPIESRKLWREVLVALAKRDHEEATNKKFDIENSQRIEAKKRAEDGVEFVPNLFKKIPNPSSVEDEILEFTIYKDLKGDDTDEEELLKIFPILPGQEFNDEFKIPQYNKH